MLRLEADQDDFIAGHEVQGANQVEEFEKALFIDFSYCSEIDQDVRVVAVEYGMQAVAGDDTDFLGGDVAEKRDLSDCLRQ